MCVEEEATEEPLLEEDELYMVYDVNAISRSEMSVPLKIQNNNCGMQLDTECALSLAPMSFFKRVCPDVDVQPTNVVLSTYTGETVRPLGEAYVKVEYSGLQHSLPLLVVQEGTSALFGRNWLMDIKLDWKNLPGLNHIGPISLLRQHLRETLHWTLFYSNMMNYFSPSSDVTLVSLLC